MDAAESQQLHRRLPWRKRTGLRSWGWRWWCQGPAHRRAGLAPPGWPIGWRARAASPSLHLASCAWFRVAHASVCVRAAAAGLGRAPAAKG